MRLPSDADNERESCRISICQSSESATGLCARAAAIWRSQSLFVGAAKHRSRIRVMRGAREIDARPFSLIYLRTRGRGRERERVASLRGNLCCIHVLRDDRCSPGIGQSSRLLSYECIVSRVPTVSQSTALALAHIHCTALSRGRSTARAGATLNYLVNEITSRVK